MKWDVLESTNLSSESDDNTSRTSIARGRKREGARNTDNCCSAFRDGKSFLYSGLLWTLFAPLSRVNRAWVMNSSPWMDREK